MKDASAIWILLAGCAYGAMSIGQTADGTISGINVDDEMGTSNMTSQQMPACVQTCEDRLLPEHPCDISAADNPNCCTPDLHDDLTSCIQTTCQSLAELTSWQKHRATACNITPRDDSEHQIALSYAFFTISTVSLAARFLSRSSVTSGPGFWWDDWVALIVWMFSLELLICLPFLDINHVGVDITGPVSVENVRIILVWEYISIPFYLVSTYGAKIALILLYLRTWEANTRFRKFCWISIALLVAAIVGFSVSGLVITWPLRYYIGDTAVVRHSFYGVEIYPAIFSIAAINVVMDFWVVLMPITKLMALRGLSKGRRYGISVIFLLGFIVTACSIVRITYIVPLRNSTNPSWDFGHFGVWSQIEAHLSMVTCNLPAMAGLVHRLRSRYKNRQAGRILVSEELQSRPTTTESASFVAHKASDSPRVQALSELEMGESRMEQSHGNGDGLCPSNSAL